MLFTRIGPMEIESIVALAAIVFPFAVLIGTT